MWYNKSAYSISLAQYRDDWPILFSYCSVIRELQLLISISYENSHIYWGKSNFVISLVRIIILYGFVFVWYKNILLSLRQYSTHLWLVKYCHSSSNIILCHTQSHPILYEYCHEENSYCYIFERFFILYLHYGSDSVSKIMILHKLLIAELLFFFFRISLS